MTKSPNQKPIDLSVVILNYNCGEYLANCLKSLKKIDLKKYRAEFIIVDNHSTDNSFILGKAVNLANTKYLSNSKNLGFAAGNNRGLKLVSPSSRYVLFLNNDTTVEPDCFYKMIRFFDTHSQVDAATCYVNLVLTQSLQPECHRGFPNPWNTFCHFFLPFMPKLFPKSKLFNGYFLGHLDYSKIQKIDCCVGAFLMVKKQVGESIGWWNEKYFFYGEDLDFCYQLKKNHYNLYYYPHCRINHFQGTSSGIAGGVTHKITQASRETKIRSAIASTNAMRIFYQENLLQQYPKSLHQLILLGIKFLEYYRVFKAKYL